MVFRSVMCSAVMCSRAERVQLGGDVHLQGVVVYSDASAVVSCEVRYSAVPSCQARQCHAMQAM